MHPGGAAALILAIGLAVAARADAAGPDPATRLALAQAQTQARHVDARIRTLKQGRAAGLQLGQLSLDLKGRRLPAQVFSGFLPFAQAPPAHRIGAFVSGAAGLPATGRGLASPGLTAGLDLRASERTALGMAVGAADTSGTGRTGLNGLSLTLYGTGRTAGLSLDGQIGGGSGGLPDDAGDPGYAFLVSAIGARWEVSPLPDLTLVPEARFGVTGVRLSEADRTEDLTRASLRLGLEARYAWHLPWGEVRPRLALTQDYTHVAFERARQDSGGRTRPPNRHQTRLSTTLLRLGLSARHHRSGALFGLDHVLEMHAPRAVRQSLRLSLRLRY